MPSFFNWKQSLKSLLNAIRSGRGDFLWTHTTASMGIAYMTTSDAKATTVMSRLPPRTDAAASSALAKESDSRKL